MRVVWHYASYNRNCSFNMWFYCEKWLEEMACSQYRFLKIVLPLVAELCFRWAILVLQWKPSLLAHALINTQRIATDIIGSKAVCKPNGIQLALYSKGLLPRLVMILFQNTKQPTLAPSCLDINKIKIRSTNLWGTENTKRLKRSFWVELSLERSWKL